MSRGVSEAGIKGREKWLHPTVYLWDVISCPCHWYLPRTQHSHIKYNKTKYDKMSVLVWPLYHPVYSEHIQHTAIISMTDIFWKQERGIKHAILNTTCHDDVIKWKHFPRYWPFVRGIRRSSVNSPHTKDSDAEVWYFLWWAWTNGWVNVVRLVIWDAIAPIMTSQ